MENDEIGASDAQLTKNIRRWRADHEIDAATRRKIIFEGVETYEQARAVRLAAVGDHRIYFIQASDFIKIGITTNLKKRLIAMAVYCPFPVKVLGTLLGDCRLEAELHLQFAALRHHGEWFRAEPELLRWIEEHTQNRKHHEAYDHKAYKRLEPEPAAEIVPKVKKQPISPPLLRYHDVFPRPSITTPDDVF